MTNPTDDRPSLLALAHEALRQDEAATKGPWLADSGSVPIADTGDYDPYWCIRVKRQRTQVLAHFDGEEGENDANVALVVFARNNIAHLARAVIAQQREIERLRKAIKESRAVIANRDGEWIEACDTILYEALTPPPGAETR